MNEYEEIGGEDYFIAVLEEIRNENIMRTSMCNCSPGGEGDPCPHGHFIEQAMTEAEWAKAELKQWKYIPEEVDVEEEDILLPDEVEDEDDEEGINLNAPNVINSGASASTDPGESETNEDWYFDEEDGEWKTR